MTVVAKAFVWDTNSILRGKIDRRSASPVVPTLRSDIMPVRICHLNSVVMPLRSTTVHGLGIGANVNGRVAGHVVRTGCRWQKKQSSYLLEAGSRCGLAQLPVGELIGNKIPGSEIWVFGLVSWLLATSTPRRKITEMAKFFQTSSKWWGISFLVARVWYK